MRNRLLLICILGTACTSWAQTKLDSRAEIDASQVSPRIVAVETTPKSFSSAFSTVSNPIGPVLESPNAPATQNPDAPSGKPSGSHHRRLRNALIGAAIGGGAGAGISAGIWESHGFLGGKGTGAAVGGGIGAVGGLIVGALWPTHHK
jgi:hypothetical protein